jgi:hypothetical protein
MRDFLTIMLPIGAIAFLSWYFFLYNPNALADLADFPKGVADILGCKLQAAEAVTVVMAFKYRKESAASILPVSQ